MKTIFKVLIFLLIFSTFSNAELLNPNSAIKPKEVIKIQLNGLQKMTLNSRIVELNKHGILLTQIIRELLDH